MSLDMIVNLIILAVIAVGAVRRKPRRYTPRPPRGQSRKPDWGWLPHAIIWFW